MKHILRLSALMIIASLFIGGGILRAQPAHAATFNQNKIMDDAVFDDYDSMTTADIQNFLNSFPNSCLKNYQAPYPQDYFTYGSNVSAATVISRAANLWGISPKVILATLQKESSTVTGSSGCGSIGYNAAMGMGCPDSGTCPAPEYAGFSKQVTKGAWQLKFSRERADGNMSWDGDNSVYYYGYMTQGNRARVDGGSSQYYDGYATIDSTSVHMDNGATAALYTYTPHFHGNQNFFDIFNSWFGSPFVPSYGWAVIGQTAYTDSSKTTKLNPYDVNITAQNSAYLTVTARNLGTTTWTQSGSGAIHLATYVPGDRSSPFCTSGWLSCNRPAQMTETSVAPGQNATFSFPIKAPLQGGGYREYYNLVAEGKSWFNDVGMYYPIHVAPLQYTWNIVQQSAYLDSARTIGSPNWTARVTPGQKMYMTIKAKNNGNFTWTQANVHLGTTDDRSSPFCTSPGWLSCTRPAQMVETSVAPGQTATFNFTITAPSKLGGYREYYNLVSEGRSWFSDPGMYYPIQVQSPDYSWSVIGQAAYSDSGRTAKLNPYDLHLSTNQTVYLTVAAKNTGNTFWDSSVRLATSSPNDRISPFCTSGWIGCSRPATLVQTSVAPGQVGTFQFAIKAPTTARTTREYYSLVAEGKMWMNNPGLYFPIVVQ